MIDVKNTRTLSDFQKNAKAHIRRLKKTGKPEVLTVNGEAELVVQSADAYQQLFDAADLADSVRILQPRIEAADRGAKGIPAKRAFAQIRKRINEGR